MSSTASNSSSSLVASNQETLAEQFRTVRCFSTRIAEPLSAEDCAIQSMPDVSPTRWHLAHTTWFFETFLLSELKGYRHFDNSFEYLFNSYYNTVGKQFPRDQRGLISRPGINETLDYRVHVDQRVARLLEEETLSANQLKILEIGLQHEQQHQELMLTDIKHVLFCNPLHPAYSDRPIATCSESVTPQWVSEDERITRIGHDDDGFAYDNESPVHNALLSDHQLCTHLITNGEYLDFVDAGGYQQPEHWLSLGWSVVNQQQWTQPLYWVKRDGRWFEFTLAGLQPLDLGRPVCHVSFFEADAFARWAGARLPTEFEWEYHAQSTAAGDGIFADRLTAQSQSIHPVPESAQIENDEPGNDKPGNDDTENGESSGKWLRLGNLWQWTSSPYVAYPGYRVPPGALGEYNGKFMCNQFVLRGGSCATSATHIRNTYRNFFPPEARWQFAGIRLAK